MLINKIILVTGGCGAIGSNLVQYLSKNNEVIIIDNLSSGKIDNLTMNQNITFYPNDIRDIEIIEKIFEKYDIDIVFHLAANFANQNSVDHPLLDLDVNGKGTLLLLKYSRKYKIERFIYASSSGVYGSINSEMIEDKIGDLETPYYIHKMLGEYYTNYFFNQYNLPIVNIRIFNSYGHGELWGEYRNVIPNFFYKALKGESLTITGTGNETRDFTFVNNIVEGLVLSSIKEKAIGETINLGNGTPITINELAEKINKLTNNKASIKYIPRRKWDGILHRKANIEKAKRLLDWKPKTNLEQGLKIYYKWLKEKYDLYNNASI